MFKFSNIKKETIEEKENKKNITPLDYISYLTNNKKKWDNLTIDEQKQFPAFIILKWLSMSEGLTPYISLILKYTIGVLDNQQIYMFLYYLLPKQKFYFNYIKKNKTEKYPQELIEIFIKEFELSKKEIINYIDFYKKNEIYIKKVMAKYGKNEKEINKILKELK